MGFANLSPLATAAGLAALAAVLYGLQRLRIRFRERPVATLRFWKAAATDAPARTLTHRFRHLWAYLLILSICSLLWLAIAEPRWQDDAQADDFYVLLLDGSAGMAREGSFEQALVDLERDLAGLPADRRQVIWSGALAETLLKPGEHPLLLQQRLTGKQVEAVPSSIEQQLAQLASVRRTGFVTELRVYGDAPVSAALLNRLPDGVSVARGSGNAEPRTGNVGITALGVAHAASGKWGKVDLLFRVEGDDAYLPDAAEIVVQVDGEPLAAGSLLPDTDGVGYRVRDLPANGALFSVALDIDDALPLDNRAQLRLPDRQTIKVQLSEALPAVVATALSADSAIELVSGNPDVVIRNKGELLGGRVPALEFVDAGRQTEAFLLGYPEHASSADAGALLRTAVQRIGLDNIDATALADVTRRPVEVAMRSEEEWTFSVWRELLSEDYNFVQSRSFPLFVAQSVRWLAGVEKWYPYLAAARPLPVPWVGSAPSFADAEGNVIDTLGVDFIPGRAGSLRRAGNSEALEISLLDSVATGGAGHGALGSNGLNNSQGALDLNVVRNSLPWLLLLALAGLLVEWFLYRQGRMP